MRRMWIALAVLAVVALGLAAWLYAPDRPRAALEALYAGPPSTFVEAASLTCSPIPVLATLNSIRHA